VDAETLHVVIGVAQRVDLELAAVARAGIDMADRQAAPQARVQGAVNLDARCLEFRIDEDRRGSVTTPVISDCFRMRYIRCS
jgi:hypothetical protein